MSDLTEVTAPDQNAKREQDGARSSQLTRLKVGLAIGFGFPFALGVAFQCCVLLGWSIDLSAVRLTLELTVIVALLILTVRYERLPLGALGIHRVRVPEIYLGLAVGLGLVLLSAAIAGLFAARDVAGKSAFANLVSAMTPADSIRLGRVPLWLAILSISASTLAEEIAARGYAIRRLRAITGGAAFGAAAALAIDIIARLPLWGLRYTLVILPAEAVLVALYVWRRQLMTCIVAHLTMILFIFMAIRFGGVRPFDTNSEVALPSLDEEMAIVQVRRALGQATGPGSAAADRAQTFYFKHDYPHALEQIEEAIRIEPKNPSYLGVRAAVRAAQDNAWGAIADYTAMLELRPDDPRIYRARAKEYKLMREFKKAAADIEKAITLAPKDALNFEERASLHYWQQQYPQAIGDLTTAIGLDPANRRLLMDRAVFYEHIAQHSSALDDCNTLVKSDPVKADGYECRVNVYLSMGNASSAMVNLNLAIARAPDEAGLYADRGGLEMSYGKWREAHADFEKVASLAPDDPLTTDGVAWRLATSAYDEVRDGKAALALALRENELTGYDRSKYLETLAAAYAEVGDTATAVKWETAALAASDAEDPDDREEMRRRLKVFQGGSALRETDTSTFSTPRPARAMIAPIITLALAAIGLVALLYWSAQWSLRRASRAGTARA